MRDRLFTPLPSSCQCSSSAEQVNTKLIELFHVLLTPAMWKNSNVCLVLMVELLNPGAPQSVPSAGQLKVLSDHRSREGLTRSWCNCCLADFTGSTKLQSRNRRELCCLARPPLPISPLHFHHSYVFPHHHFHWNHYILNTVICSSCVLLLSCCVLLVTTRPWDIF